MSKVSLTDALSPVQTRILELITLLEIIAEKSSDIIGKTDEIRQVQDLASIAVPFAQAIEKDVNEIIYPGDV